MKKLIPKCQKNSGNSFGNIRFTVPDINGNRVEVSTNQPDPAKGKQLTNTGTTQRTAKVEQTNRQRKVEQSKRKLTQKEKDAYEQRQHPGQIKVDGIWVTPKHAELKQDNRSDVQRNREQQEQEAQQTWDKVNDNLYYQTNSLRLGDTQSSLGQPNKELALAKAKGNVESVVNTVNAATFPGQVAMALHGGYGLYDQYQGDRLGLNLETAGNALEIAPLAFRGINAFKGSNLWQNVKTPQYIVNADGSTSRIWFGKPWENTVSNANYISNTNLPSVYKPINNGIQLISNSKTGLPLINSSVSYPTTVSDLGKTPKKYSTEFKSELDWTPENWFNTRELKGYTAEEAEALRDHTSLFEAIEKEAKANGEYLKMPDGSNWEGDPRTWILFNTPQGKNWLLEHHYTGVTAAPTFNRHLSFPRYMGDIWSGSTPKEVAEYARAGKNGDIKAITEEEYLQKIKALEKDIQDKGVEDLGHKLLRYKLNSAYLLGQGNEQGAGYIFDVSYPKETNFFPVMDLEGSHWSDLSESGLLRTYPRRLAKIDLNAARTLSKILQQEKFNSTDDLVQALKREGYPVTKLNNIMDSSDGHLLNETIITEGVPRISLLGNTGEMNGVTSSGGFIYRKNGGKLIKRKRGTQN